LRVARRDQRQPLGLGGWVARTGYQLAGLDLEQTGEEDDGALPRHRHARFEVRDRGAGHRQAIGELLLRVTELGAECGNAAPEALVDRFLAHVPTHFADSPAS